jgi:hypothetical protein
MAELARSRADSIWVNPQILPAAIRHAAKWERLGLVEDFQDDNSKGEEEGGGGATPYGRGDYQRGRRNGCWVGKPLIL